jgi:ketosteroid isomerase-like protein
MTVSTTVDLEQVAQRYFAAWEVRDPDAIGTLHTEDSRFWLHTGIESVSGREAVRDVFAWLFEQFPNFGFITHRVLFGADHWVLDWTATYDGPDGKQRAFDCVDVVVVSPDGLVARKDTFVDAAQLEAAAK